jgi:hypothetical protein
MKVEEQNKTKKLSGHGLLLLLIRLAEGLVDPYTMALPLQVQLSLSGDCPFQLSAI